MIRAVDMAIPLQRATEMNPTQRGEQRAELQQQQFAARLNKEQEEQKSQVKETPKGEEAMIQKDGRGNSGGHNGGKNKKKGNKDEQNGQATVLPPLKRGAGGSMFDISM